MADQPADPGLDPRPRANLDAELARAERDRASPRPAAVRRRRPSAPIVAVVASVALVLVGMAVIGPRLAGIGSPAGEQPATPSAGPSGAPSLPQIGRTVPFDEVSLSADGRTLTLEFVGSIEYSAGNPCSADYAAWTEPDGEVLRAAVLDITTEDPDAPDVECTAEGYPRTVSTVLPAPFTGSVVEDLTGGTHVLPQAGTPALPAAETVGTVTIPFAGRTMTVTLVAEPGTLAAWRAATDDELGGLSWDQPDGIGMAALGDRQIALGWIGTVCDVEATLTATARELVVSPAPHGGCDAMGVGRGVVLTYVDAIDADGLDASVADGAPALSPWGPLAVIAGADGADTARTEGTLRVGDDCVVLQVGGREELLVWPADRTRWDVRSGDIEFDNPDGTTASVVDGDRVILGGGGGSTDEDGAWADRLPWIAPPSEACPLDAYWVVGSVER